MAWGTKIKHFMWTNYLLTVVKRRWMACQQIKSETYSTNIILYSIDMYRVYILYCVGLKVFFIAIRSMYDV